MTDPKGAKLAEADKAKLRAAAEKATPGPWHDCDDEDIATVAPGADCSSAESFIAVQFDNRDDARYIAAVNPAVILALLDELAALQAAATAPETTDRERAGKFIARYRDCFPDVLDKWPMDQPMPDLPGLLTRLGLARELAAEFAAVRVGSSERSASELDWLRARAAFAWLWARFQNMYARPRGLACVTVDEAPDDAPAISHLATEFAAVRAEATQRGATDG